MHYILGGIFLLIVVVGFLWWRAKKIDDIMNPPVNKKDGPGEERH